MDPVLALILGCLLTFMVAGAGVVLWQVSKRLKRVQERLEAMQVLSLLPDRVQALSRVVEDLDPGLIREEFERIHTALARLEALAASPAGAAPPEISRADVVRALVHRWLRDEGYRSARLLDGETDFSKDPVAIQVRGILNGTQIEGSVLVRGDEVVEATLEPDYRAFP
ncbi:MAG: hypothetical protein HOM34_02515 [Planctomycetes bacterium]|jgi:hypothetical protein|nr:hypothetical protein [Planctomycetota bacterium]MBT4028566.1 hypothetical protein [Planctomycetota bacterium]MBT4559458.1 hypothetical protein [Planctomycetota bacterium]MBT5101278.1 hypothetical protein [Planctomycetota bacterium]MBT5119577.1 hypothetical protein [Planctomycetota bacterium]